MLRQQPLEPLDAPADLGEILLPTAGNLRLREDADLVVPAALVAGVYPVALDGVSNVGDGGETRSKVRMRMVSTAVTRRDDEAADPHVLHSLCASDDDIPHTAPSQQRSLT
jgi:hypothetical protein